MQKNSKDCSNLILQQWQNSTAEERFVFLAQLDSLYGGWHRKGEGINNLYFSYLAKVKKPKAGERNYD